VTYIEWILIFTLILRFLHYPPLVPDLYIYAIGNGHRLRGRNKMNSDQVMHITVLMKKIQTLNKELAKYCKKQELKCIASDI
jgi:hypothetical protein